MIRILMLIIFLLNPLTQVWAEEVYFSDHERGWHWYEKKIEANEEEYSEDPDTQMSQLRGRITTSLNKAILNPTDENIIEYKKYQDDLAKKSAKFASKWEYVLLTHPEFDNSLVHPTNALARRVEIEENRKTQDNAIRSLFSESGLFFFYHSTCPYCQRFAPILKHFAEEYGIDVIPITTDGIALPEFPQSKIDNGQAKVFGVTVEPALYAVNPHTGKWIPINFGLVSEEELRSKILVMSSAINEVGK